MSAPKRHRSASLAMVMAFVMAVQAMAQSLTVPAGTPLDAAPFLITVLDGDGSINNIREEVNRPITVRVEDPNCNPITGASVSFFLPDDGPTGFFLNGSRALTTFTDSQGIATSRTVRFNNIVGSMRIRVTASVFSQSASVYVTQTNVSSGAATRTRFDPGTGLAKIENGKPFPTKKVVIWGIVLAGAGAAAYILLNRSKPPSASVTVGSPVITAPQ